MECILCKMQYVGNYGISKLVWKLLFILVLYPSPQFMFYSLSLDVYLYIYIYIYRYILYIYSYTVKGIHMNNDDMLYASHLKFIEADEVFLTCFTTKINQVATNVKNFKKL